MNILKFTLPILFILLCNTPSNTQDLIIELFTKGVNLIAEDKALEAKGVFEEVAELTLQEGEIGYHIYALCYLSFSNMELADYKSMHKSANQASAIYDEWEDKDERVLPTVAYLLGISYYRLGDPSLGITHLQSSFNLNKKHNTLAFRLEDLLYNLALCHLHFADYEKVRLYMNLAKQTTNDYINIGDYGQWNNLIAKSYQYEENFELANEYYQLALVDIEAIKKLKRKSYSLIILNNYISYLISKGSLEEAENQIREIEALRLNKTNLVNHKQNLAKLAFKKNEKEKALLLFDEVIQVARSTNNYKDITESYIDIARAYYDEKNYDETLKFIDSSLQINRVNDQIDPNKDKRQYLIPKLAIESLLLKAKTEANTEYSGSRKTSFEILELIQFVVKHDLSIFESKLHLVQFIRSYIKELIDLALTNGDAKGAYYLCQQSHGLVLDLQIDENAIKREILSEEILNRDKSFKREITKLQSEILYLENSARKESVNSVRSQIFSLQYDYDQFSDSLFNHFPQLNHKFNSDDHKIEDLQNKLLTEESALIEYFIENNQLYVFCITRDSIFTHQQNLSENFDDLVTEYISCLKTFSNDKFDPFLNSSSELYVYLLSPVVESLDQNIIKLHIIPDGILNYISFDALIDTYPESIDNNRYDLLDYVINKYEIDYNYSSLLYTFENSSIDQDLTGFAPSFTSDSTLQNSMNPLIHNIDEILKIEKIIDGDMFIDSSAILVNFVKSVNDYNIAHLATHAICNDSIPMKSSIYFQDKVLNTYEIYNMPNSLDLVVLSACNTGTGKLRNGEGIMSLARAFIASGCNSIVTSLWNVNDRTSVSLMTDFYKELSEGKSVSHSLRTAKLNYIGNPSSILDAHPYYWSGFVLVGDDISFSDKTYFRILLSILGIFILVLLFIFFLRTK